MLTVHHLGHSQSDRVIFLCEELCIEYDLKKYDRSPVLAGPEYKALHPLGAAPVIEDGSVKLAETAACFEYILHVYGKGRLTVKPDEKNYADYLYWYHLTQGTLQPAIGRTFTLTLAGIKSDNPTYIRYSEKTHDIYKMIDERLAQVPFLAGENFTAADCMLIFSLTTMREFLQIDLSAYKYLLKYAQNVVDRPAYKRYLEKGDPDIDISKSVQGPPPPKFGALGGHK